MQSQRNKIRTSRRTASSVSRSLMLLILGGLLVSSCTFWKNFSTYFNLLYLAQQHLDIYEDKQKEPPPALTGGQAVLNHRWLDEEYETRENARKMGKQMKIVASFVKPRGAFVRPGVGQQSSTTHLDSAIILGSKILAERKESKYVEDALFIVGKAQLLKGDVSGAKRKFLELQYKYPDTKYSAEVQMLMGRSLLGSNQFDSAKRQLDYALDRAKGSDNEELLAQVYLARAEYVYLSTPDSLNNLIAELTEAEKHLDGDRAARIAFELGTVQYLSGKWSDAEQSFARAVDQASEPFFEGEAKIAHALALRRVGSFDQAKQELNQVLAKAKYSSSYPVAKYELAYTDELAARMAVHDDLKSSEFRSRYFPQLSEGYFTVDTSLKNESFAIVARSKFRQAEIYRAMGEFDSASKLSVHLINTKEFSTPEMNDYVSERMRALGRFAQWKSELVKMDSAERDLKRARNGGYLDPTEEQAAYTLASQQTLGSRWRPDRQVDLSEEDKRNINANLERIRKDRIMKNSLASIGIQDTTRFTDSLHYRMAHAHFEIGRSYENFQLIDTARMEYKRALDYRFIVSDTAKDLFRAQVLYAWLQLEDRDQRTAVRDSLYKELLTYYTQSIYAQQAIVLYGGPGNKDTPAERAYTAAYQTLKSSGLEAGKSSMLGVVDSYRKEDVAARSLYAIGLSYEDIGRYDSAVSYYRQVLNSYPYSAYADALRPRLADATPVPQKQTARRVDLGKLQSEEEKQKEAAEKIRKENERIRKEQLERMQRENPGLPPIESTPAQVTPSTPDSTPPVKVDPQN